MRRFSIKSRVLLLGFFGVLVGLFILGVISVDALQKAQEQIFNERLELAKSTAHQIDARIQFELTTMESFTRFDGINLADSDFQPEQHLLSTLNRTGYFACDVFITDQNGVVLIAEPADSPLIGNDLSNLPHIKAALQSGLPQVSNHFKCDILGQPNSIALIAPIKDKDGKVLGLLAGVTNPRSRASFNLTSEFPTIPGGHMDLVDSNRNVLASSNANFIAQPSHHKSILKLLEEQQPAILQDEFTEPNGQPGGYSLLIYAPLENAPWGVIIAQPEEIALQPVVILRGQFIAAGIAIGLIALLLIFMETVAIIHPLEQLLKATRQLSAGNLSAPLKISGRDEFTELTRSFETMRQRLAEWGNTLNEAVNARAHELSTLYDISTSLRSTESVDEILKVVLEKTLSSLKADAGIIFQWDETSSQLAARCAQGAFEELLGLRCSLGEGICGYVVRQHKSCEFTRADVTQPSEYQPREFLKYTECGICAPMLLNEQLVGVLTVANTGLRAWSNEDKNLLQAIADMATSAIQRASMHEELEHLFIEVVRTLTAAIDARDPYTHGHSAGVAHLSQRLARKNGWNETELELLDYAAFLHDVGKIAIPDHILKKMSR
ncbi:MAG: cache domain-containing protein [Anaerolineales bacterium]|nr:cache domain-containing protein [Anaerolineales bacterium]